MGLFLLIGLKKYFSSHTEKIGLADWVSEKLRFLGI